MTVDSSVRPMRGERNSGPRIIGERRQRSTKRSCTLANLGQIHVEQHRPALRRDFDIARGRRNQNRIAATAVAASPSSRIRQTLPFDDRQNVKAIVIAVDARAASMLPAIEHELVAGHESFDTRSLPSAVGRAAFTGPRPKSIVSSACSMCSWSRLAVAVDAVPIEQPISRVAGLLDLGDQQPCTQRVHRSGFDETRNRRRAARTHGDTCRTSPRCDFALAASADPRPALSPHKSCCPARRPARPRLRSFPGRAGRASRPARRSDAPAPKAFADSRET